MALAAKWNSGSASTHHPHELRKNPPNDNDLHHGTHFECPLNAVSHLRRRDARVRAVPSNEKAKVMRAANEIQRYLESHPNAADTAEGIAKWWLLRQRFEDSVVLVQQALDYLLAESAVARKINLDGEQVYFGTSRPPKDES